MPSYHVYCRVCALIIVKPTTYLFSGSEESNEIIRKINLCTQVRINNEQSFASFATAICSECLSELKISYSFRLKCLASGEKLRELGLTCNDPQVEINADESVSDVNVENGLECTTCNKILKNQSSLQRHKKSMHINRKHLGKVTGSGPTRMYHCTECSYSTPHSQTLVNHIRIHSGEKPFNCHCGKTFSQSASLIAHSKTHSNKTFFTCFTCGKQFKHLYSLKKHYRVHEKPTFECSICGQHVKNKETLNGHMDRHNNIRNYNCEECGDTFCTSSGLINHKKKHIKDENMQCHLCGYKTPWKKVLLIHLRRHTGERPFKCDRCNQCCYTKSELSVHQRKHTREKPYSCPICAQQFMFSSSLNKHMRNIHHSNYKWGQDKHNLSKLTNTKTTKHTAL